jgi:hypothetical protein
MKISLPENVPGRRIREGSRPPDRDWGKNKGFFRGESKDLHKDNDIDEIAAR